MNTDDVKKELDDLLISYIHLFRRIHPEYKDSIFHLCRFLKQEGQKYKFRDVKTHFNKIKQDLIITSKEVVNNDYDENYFEGGFSAEDIYFGLQYQLSLNNISRKMIN